jgi:CHAT domain
MPPNRILVLAANPSDTQGLKLRQEVDEIQAALARSKNRDQFEVIAEQNVRPDDLRRALLKHQPRIVHFSGHGTGELGLMFANEVGQAKLVDTDTLTNLFKLCPGIECVVLNACFSAMQADAIAQHIDHVIGMTHEINDRSALKFATGFYEALGYGRSIKDAFEFGLVSVDLNGLPASAIPVLRSRPSPNPDDSESDFLPDPSFALEEPVTFPVSSSVVPVLNSVIPVSDSPPF